MTDYLVPAEPFRLEFTVQGSRFIASIAPALSTAEARDFIESIRQEYPDATHHVPVYLVGHGATVTAHCSDAGEPSGTAGRPALSVLKGSNLGDIVLVITRYFGGTKLGTGGLVRAYSEAARLAVQQVPKATRIAVHQICLECPYSIYENLTRLVTAHQGKILQEQFTDRIKLDFAIPVSKYESFQSATNALSSGQVKISLTSANQVALVPLA